MPCAPLQSDDRSTAYSPMVYCEQLLSDGGFEPLNALTNVAFLCAALYADSVSKRRPHAVCAASKLALGLIVAIGLGSFAWHATGHPVAELADVIPIAGFALVFLHTVVHRVMGGSKSSALAACAGLLAAVIAVTLLFPQRLNGSLAYLPLLIALAVLSLSLRYKAREFALILTMSTGVFFLSLIFRSVDLAVCPSFPRGTHWMWHVLNALVLALLFDGLLRELQRQREAHSLTVKTTGNQ